LKVIDADKKPVNTGENHPHTSRSHSRGTPFARAIFPALDLISSFEIEIFIKDK
jgi:hypothetical protein